MKTLRTVGLVAFVLFGLWLAWQVVSIAVGILSFILPIAIVGAIVYVVTAWRGASAHSRAATTQAFCKADALRIVTERLSTLDPSGSPSK